MKNKWTIIFIISLIIAGGFSLLASTSPDGLESSAINIGLDIEEQANYKSLMPDYQILGIKNEILSSALAGIIGTIIVYLVVLLISKLINKKEKQKKLPNT